MNKYQETFKTWNKIAQLYEDKFMDLDIYNDTYDLVVKSLKKNATILEVGCGPGNISKYLLAKNSNLKIKGIDISENMIKLAKKNNPFAEFEVMDCREISKLNGKFDAIICGFCIPYLSKTDCLNLISDCKNLLTSSGVFYLSFMDGSYEKSGYISGNKSDKAYFYYHSLTSIKKYLKDNNFKINELIDKNYSKSDGTKEIHSIIISKKTNI
jgi:2-polyprenyl-3-methyl-5-hydroxy-6-metoxy-1,4-benzoquinol methylase